MRSIVCDTGPIAHLCEVGALELLRSAGDVAIPCAVEVELRALVTPWPPADAWIHVVDLDDEHESQAKAWVQAGIIHAGESAAIALVRQISADWFLTDDSAARLLAATLGVEVHGSLGVILWAAATRAIDHAHAARLLDALAHSTLWVSDRVMVQAQSALERIFR